MRTTHSTQRQKKQTTWLKRWAEDLIVLQRRHADGQQASEKMLDLANYQGSKQNHSEYYLYLQNGYHQKEYKKQMLVRMWENLRM